MTQSAGARAGDARTVGPQAAGPREAARQDAGPREAEPYTAEPYTAGPHGAGPRAEARHAGAPGAEEARRDPVASMFAADEASRGLGIELLEHTPGTAVARMRVTASMVNGHGIAHGGYVFLLADTAFACACNGEGPVTVAAGADIDFVAPAREGDVLTATAVERVRFGRSGVYDVTVLRDGSVIAEFRGRSRSVGGRGIDDRGADGRGADGRGGDDRGADGTRAEESQR